MSALARCLRWSVAAFAFTLLASCGGGGGGGGAPGSGGSLVINPTALDFSAEQNGAKPPPLGVTATYTEPNVAILVAGFPAGTTLPTWLDLTISGLSSPFTVNVIPNTTVLSPGTYTATVRIATAAADHTLISFRDASVSYTINGFVTASPASLSFDELVGQTTPGAQNLTVSDTGNRSYAWSAGITYQSGTSWLMLNGLSTAGGQTVPAPSVSVTVNGTSLQPGTYQATINISGNGKTSNVPVIYTRRAPQVSFVAPYVGFTSVAGQVIIRGSGFDTITTQKVKFGSFDAVSASVINDTEIHARYPALPADSYSVFVENSTRNQYTRASLVIVDAPQFADEAITRSGLGAALDLIYDAERSAVYVASSNGAIDRYRHNGSGWTADSLTIADLRAFALSPDGKEIVALVREDVVHVDANTFTVAATVPAPFTFIQATLFDLKSIAVANNGVAIILTESPTTSGPGDPGFVYDILSRTFTPLAFGIFGFSDGVAAAAGDGSRIVALGQGGSPAGQTHWYDASTGSFNSTSLFRNGGFVAVNKTGTKFLHGFTSVYDSTFVGPPLGNLPNPDPGSSTFGSVAFSPIADFIYLYSNTTATIRKFNLASPNGSGGFLEVGSPTPAASTPLVPQAMVVSPDGGKLFMADSNKLQVQAAP